jgi:hypothetical protein
LPSHPRGAIPAATHHPGPLLDPATLPELPPEPARPELRRSPTVSVLRQATDRDRRRGEAYMDTVIADLETTAPGGRNTTLNHAAWTIGRWVAAGALDQAEVEEELYAATEANGLIADDGQRQCWATIRSGLSAGLQQPIDLDADDRPPRTRPAAANEAALANPRRGLTRRGDAWRQAEGRTTVRHRCARWSSSNTPPGRPPRPEDSLVE